MRLLITGGAGFIGSTLCRYTVNHLGWTILNVDKLTYAANLASVSMLASNERYTFAQADICDTRKMQSLLADFQPDAIAHLAAESHVDRSIDGPSAFIQTNLVGTLSLLEAARDYFNTLPKARMNAFRFLHVSTDEVYGSLGETGLFSETTPYAPNSPYSASKAGSDHLARAWHETYGLPVLTSNCSNNYGPYQFPEKLIPLMILNVLRGQPLPIYGDGKNCRDWLHVDDHVAALALLIKEGQPGQTYNVGGHNEATNLSIVETLCDLVAEQVRDLPVQNTRELISFVTDRPGHDQRYAIDSSKIQKEIGWKAKHDLSSGLASTVQWYVKNRDWWQPILENTYQGQRLGGSNTCEASRDNSTSMPNPSRLKSSMTLNVRKERPSPSWSCLKSMNQT